MSLFDIRSASPDDDAPPPWRAPRLAERVSGEAEPTSNIAEGFSVGADQVSARSRRGCCRAAARSGGSWAVQAALRCPCAGLLVAPRRCRWHLQGSNPKPCWLKALVGMLGLIDSGPGERRAGSHRAPHQLLVHARAGSRRHGARDVRDRRGLRLASLHGRVGQGGPRRRPWPRGGHGLRAAARRCSRSRRRASARCASRRRARVPLPSSPRCAASARRPPSGAIGRPVGGAPSPRECARPHARPPAARRVLRAFGRGRLLRVRARLRPRLAAQRMRLGPCPRSRWRDLGAGLKMGGGDPTVPWAATQIRCRTYGRRRSHVCGAHGSGDAMGGAVPAESPWAAPMRRSRIRRRWAARRSHRRRRSHSPCHWRRRRWVAGIPPTRPGATAESGWSGLVTAVLDNSF